MAGQFVRQREFADLQRLNSQTDSRVTVFQHRKFDSPKTRMEIE